VLSASSPASRVLYVFLNRASRRTRRISNSGLVIMMVIIGAWHAVGCYRSRDHIPEYIISLYTPSGGAFLGALFIAPCSLQGGLYPVL